MIPSLSSMAERLGVNTTYLPLLFVGLVTGFVFLVQVWPAGSRIEIRSHWLKKEK